MSLALVITVFSLLAGIVLIPVWILALAGAYVPVNALGMLKTILIAIVVPLILENLTRIGLVKWKGKENLLTLKTVSPAISALGMYSVFFISMSAEAVTLVCHLKYLLIIAPPPVILYTILFFASILCTRLGKMNYADMVAVTYGVGGKNISIALALAVLFFAPLTVMIIAIKPLIQVLFMADFFRVSSRLKRWWDKDKIWGRSGMREFVKTMKGLSDPNRVKVVKLLQKRALCGSHITKALGLAQSTKSKHLKTLLEARLISCTKEGLYVKYRLSDDMSNCYAGACSQT